MNKTFSKATAALRLGIHDVRKHDQELATKMSKALADICETNLELQEFAKKVMYASLDVAQEVADIFDPPQERWPEDYK